MKLNEATLLESVLSHDLEVIRGATREVLTMIEESPFSERICFLLTNQEIGKVPVENKRGGSSAPNCIGTAFFVAGVSTLPHPYHAYSYELNPHMVQAREKRWDDFFWAHIERRVAGAFVFSYSEHGNGWHTGIYLGEIRGEHILFAQHGHGESFGPETLARNYADPNYYIPSTLLKH